MTSCWTLSPTCRHWSMSHTPTGSYGMGMPRFLNVNENPSGTPASLSRRLASARDLLMSCP